MGIHPGCAGGIRSRCSITFLPLSKSSVGLPYGLHSVFTHRIAARLLMISLFMMVTFSLMFAQLFDLQPKQIMNVIPSVRFFTLTVVRIRIIETVRNNLFTRTPFLFIWNLVVVNSRHVVTLSMRPNLDSLGNHSSYSSDRLLCRNCNHHRTVCTLHNGHLFTNIPLSIRRCSQVKTQQSSRLLCRVHSSWWSPSFA